MERVLWTPVIRHFLIDSPHHSARRLRHIGVEPLAQDEAEERTGEWRVGETQNPMLNLTCCSFKFVPSSAIRWWRTHSFLPGGGATCADL